MAIATVKRLIKKLLPQTALDYYDRRQQEARLSPEARLVRAADRQGLRSEDCGPELAISLATGWLARAQEQATPVDGGVARHYSLNSGWSPSYPETTGYIIPTLLELEKAGADPTLCERARRMLDWLMNIQLQSGAFQGGMVSADPVPVTFNTGQILLGLAAGAARYPSENYVDGMHKAARWLVESQDADGCWRKFATPFAAPGEKTYETHVAWGLLEADRVAPGRGYGEAGLKQIHWALGNMQDNGWMADCCLSDPTRPLTHTLGYALRGVVEGYRFSEQSELLSAAELLGRGLRSGVDDTGFLAGRFESDWTPAVDWSCLTGSVQIAACFFELYRWTEDKQWLLSGKRLNRFVRQSMVLTGNPDVVGAVSGSYPIDGAYGQYEYLNWAAKFLIDSQLLELEILRAEGS